MVLTSCPVKRCKVIVALPQDLRLIRDSYSLEVLNAPAARVRQSIIKALACQRGGSAAASQQRVPMDDDDDAGGGGGGCGAGAGGDGDDDGDYANFARL